VTSSPISCAGNEYCDLADITIAYEGRHDTIPFRILGFLDDDPAAQDNLSPGYDLHGKLKELLTVVAQLRPNVLLIALTDMWGILPINDILECRFQGIRVERSGRRFSIN